MIKERADSKEWPLGAVSDALVLLLVAASAMATTERVWKIAVTMVTDRQKAHRAALTEATH